MVDSEILAGKICPYCSQRTVFMDSAKLYADGKSYGMVYFCGPCQAWVGVHKGTDRALGRLANAELRECKKLAHAHFDPLWKRKMKTGIKKKVARGLAYKWLANQLGIDYAKCHIGMFDEKTCLQVVAICRKYV